MVGVAVVSGGEPVVAEEPGDGSFDDPAEFAELRAGLDALAGHANFDSLIADPFSQVGVVVRLVGVQFPGCAATRSASGSDRRDSHYERLEGVGIVGVGRGHRHPQGKVLSGRTGRGSSSRSCRGRPGSGRSWIPFCGPDRHSVADRPRPIDHALPSSSSSTARCNRGHRPALVHSVNRRCAVGTVTPNDGGRYRHAHPLVNTKTIAVNTARSSTRAGPPPCGRTPCSGISGAAGTHNSSGTNRRDRSSTTQVHAPQLIKPLMRHAPRLAEEIFGWDEDLGPAWLDVPNVADALKAGHVLAEGTLRTVGDTA